MFPQTLLLSLKHWNNGVLLQIAICTKIPINLIFCIIDLSFIPNLFLLVLSFKLLSCFPVLVPSSPVFLMFQSSSSCLLPLPASVLFVPLSLMSIISMCFTCVSLSVPPRCVQLSLLVFPGPCAPFVLYQIVTCFLFLVLLLFFHVWLLEPFWI